MIEIGKQDVEEEIKRRFPKGVDRVIVSSPPKSLPDALKVIRYGGLITFFGIHLGGQSTVNIDINDLIFRKITLVPTFAEPAINFPISNRLLKDGLGGCVEDRDAHLRLRRCRGHDHGQRGRQPADHQGGHAAERVADYQDLIGYCQN